MHHRAATIDNSSIFPFVNDSQRQRLLVVDDHADVRKLHARALNLNGYEVETACNGAAALERCAEEEFDLVVTDRAMPILDGVSMALALRSAGCKIPILIVSRSLATASLPPQVAREFSAMLPKPARTAEILSAVSDALHCISAPGSVRRLPPIVGTVLTQATRHLRKGRITTARFEAQIERLSREELEPRGLSVLVRDLPWGVTRFIIKTTATGQVQEMIEIRPDGFPDENACASSHSNQ